MQPVKLDRTITVPAVIFAPILAIAMFGMVLVSRARAEETPPAPPAETAAPASAASPVLQKFYLELEPSDLQSISLALMELPKKIADPLILRLNAQIQNQAAQAQIALNKADAEKPKKGKK